MIVVVAMIPEEAQPCNIKESTVIMLSQLSRGVSKYSVSLLPKDPDGMGHLIKVR